MLSEVGKIYAGILIERVRRLTGNLIDAEQGDYRAGGGYIDQIFTQKPYIYIYIYIYIYLFIF